MKVRWREHEMILVTVVAAILLAGYLWIIYYKGGFHSLEDPFSSHHVSFNLYRNAFLPDLGMGLLIYLSYLFVNYFIISHLLAPQKMEAFDFKTSVPSGKTGLQSLLRIIIARYGWMIIQIAVVIVVLGSALNIAFYYKHQWLFIDHGFSFFPQKKYYANAQVSVADSYIAVLFALVLYAVYIFVREAIIYFIEIAGSRSAYRALICNQVTAFLVTYISLLFFAVVFRLFHEGQVMITYVMPVFLVFMSNTYWLFPLKGDRSFFNVSIIARLLLSTFLCTLPYALTPFHEGSAFSFIGCWAIQLFIVTPITWLLYQQRKDKILQLRGIEKALVKSKTDLQFLRSQINPHFLFNVLNTLYGTALQENAERTAGGIQKLGDMMRFMLHENNLDFILMNREIDYLKNYISLQKLRTQSSPEITIEDNIHEQHCNHKIAPMLLIPLVENAFKHGISLKERSWIKITLDCNEKEILFEVRNSMHQRPDNDPEKERSGIGLKNVLDRLKLVYPGRHQISVNGDGKEFFVRLSIQP